jgi:nucleolar protein 56
VTTNIGCFGVDEKDEILAYVKFPSNAEKIVKLLEKSREGRIPQEDKIEKELAKKGYKDIKKKDIPSIGSKLRTLAIENKFVKSPVEFNQLMSKINIIQTKKDIKTAIGRDQLIMQANNSIEEMDKSINIMMERLREWYGLHFPEMNRTVSDHKKYAKLVQQFGARASFKDPNLSHFKESSMGADFTKDDIKATQELATQIIALFKMRDDTIEYMEKLLKEIAPNTNEVAGSALAAKLISSAGGLEKLARMPSSTIQLLGAEKALFRHLHKRGKSPKHGVIINHQYLKNAPIKSRGKIARLIAAKISIAAKMDFYSKKYNGKEMKKELETKIKEISSKK